MCVAVADNDDSGGSYRRQAEPEGEDLCGLQLIIVRFGRHKNSRRLALQSESLTPVAYPSVIRILLFEVTADHRDTNLLLQ